MARINGPELHLYYTESQQSSVKLDGRNTFFVKIRKHKSLILFLLLTSKPM